jgi:hypothetical protein
MPTYRISLGAAVVDDIIYAIGGDKGDATGTSIRINER